MLRRKSKKKSSSNSSTGKNQSLPESASSTAIHPPSISTTRSASTSTSTTHSTSTNTTSTSKNVYVMNKDHHEQQPLLTPHHSNYDSAYNSIPSSTTTATPTPTATTPTEGHEKVAAMKMKMKMKKMSIKEKIAFSKMAREHFRNNNSNATNNNGLNNSNQDAIKSFQQQLLSVNNDIEKGSSHVTITNNNTIHSTTPSTTQQQHEQIIQQLQIENEMLFSKCHKLESQNIIASAQMIDFYAICLGVITTVFVYGLYIHLINYIFSHSHDWIIMMMTKMMTMIMTMIMMNDEQNQQQQQHEQIIMTSSFVKNNFILLCQCITIILPYIYNKMNHGITYRRFQVFAVAFIFIGRVKMTRWRVAKYISSSNNNNNNKNNDDNDEEDGIQDNRNRNNNNNINIPKFGEEITEDDIWESVYEINARFLYSSILRLRGLWTKTAQYMSSRADFVPTAYVRELSKLMDEAPSTDWKDVEMMLHRAKVDSSRGGRGGGGGGTFIDHFEYIEHEPIASASIGQVHIAKLKKEYIHHADGNEDEEGKVVIKVQHPHAHTLLTDDFLSLRIITRIVSILEPEFKFLEILMKEWATEARKELNFLTEVENLQIAQESVLNMEKSCDMMTNEVRVVEEWKRIPFAVEIPSPFPKLSSSRVMVMSFCEGKRIDNLDQIRKCNVPHEAVINAVSQVFAHQMYVSDIFNGDPHPGEFESSYIAVFLL